MDELERIRRDWQSDDRPRPEVQINQLRRRLWRRWLGLVTDTAVSIAVLVLILWAAFQVNDLMGAIYVGFFALLWVVLVWRGMSIRIQSFKLHDTSPTGILDQNLRNARATVRSGWLGIAAGTVVFVFFLVWLGTAAYTAGMGPIEIIADSLTGLLFVILVCTSSILAGLWMVERGRNHERHLKELLEQLTEQDEG